jgi:putative spermidine/putrescine transport system permease protein
VRIAAITTVVAVILGTLVALGVVRGRSRGLGALTSTLMMVPLLFPLVVAAAGFYLVFLRIGLVDTELGIVLAHISIAIPFVFGTVSASLRGLNPAYENAAASLGANRVTQLRRIVVPLMLPAIATGAFFAFLTSFDESTIAVFLSGVRTKTLPRRMYEGLAFESDPTIAVIAVFTIVATAVLWGGFVIMRRISRKRTGAVR